MNSKRIILLIDDSKTIHSIVKDLLDPSVVLISHYDANDSLKFLELNPVDIILCDINMPGISGVEFCLLLKDSKMHDIPLIFLTSNSDSKDVAIGLQAGADDYLIKPFNAEELKVRLKNHFRLVDLRKEREAIVNQSTYNEMVDVLSHEINNPLFIAQSYYYKLEKKLIDSDSPYKMECQKIEKSLLRIKEVLVKIRDIDNAKDYYK